MKSIYLTGFMGVGKTTIGHEAAKKMDLPIFDTDIYIEEKTGRKIKDIFGLYGEQHFRNLEEEALKDLPTEDCIITTGGGIITRQENINWMKKHGVMLFIYSDIEIILQRLENDSTRPLIQQKNKQEIKELYASRLPFYKKAHRIIDTTRDSITEATEKVFMTINSYQSGQH